MAEFACAVWAEAHAPENSIVAWASAHLSMSPSHDTTGSIRKAVPLSTIVDYSNDSDSLCIAVSGSSACLSTAFSSAFARGGAGPRNW